MTAVTAAAVVDDTAAKPGRAALTTSAAILRCTLARYLSNCFDPVLRNALRSCVRPAARTFVGPADTGQAAASVVR